MSLRLQTLAALYPSYFAQFYAQRSALAEQPYAAQNQARLLETFIRQIPGSASCNG
jgi:hypothetical protein